MIGVVGAFKSSRIDGHLVSGASGEGRNCGER